MPPYGLYPIPRHHLHGSSPVTRPVFNSLQLGGKDTEFPVLTTDTDTLQTSRGEDHIDSTILGKKEKKKKNNKGKQTHSQGPRQSGRGVDSQTPVSTPQASTTVAASSSQKKKNKKRKEPTGNGTEGETSIIRKRKRAATDQNETPSKSLQESAKGSFVVGGDMLQTLQESMGDLSSNFGHVHSPTPTQSPEKPSKKKSKADAREEKGSVSDKTTEQPPMMTNVKTTDQKAGKHESPSTIMSRTPTQGRIAPKMPSNVTPAKETPVPLPSNVSSRLDDGGGHDRESLELKRTPSKTPNTSVDISKLAPSFSLSQEPRTTGRKNSKKARKSKKERISFHVSPPTPTGANELVSSPPTLHIAQDIQDEPMLQAPLTISNLVKYTQPLNDTPKPRPLSQKFSPGAATTASSVSSLDTRGESSRTNKPYSRSGAEIDPFVTSTAKMSKHREHHEESGATVFGKKYRKAQKTTNFSDEAEYLDAHLKWQIDNNSKGPLPCLGLATGCNSKREQVLRLSKEDSSNFLKVLVTTDGEHSTLEEAKIRCTAAESFLAMAVAAKVPVPIGQVEGVWTLYCPNYSQIHIDKYGFGQRTLSIFSIPDFQDDRSYTARLSIPPRSMLYSVLSFTVPPHASFRTTTIKTSVEGYKLDLIFLGNGYLQLRVDLNLLLRGKPTETAEGKPMYMEFIGVHENAVQWREKEDELEVEGRKLFAKYDGGPQ